MKSVLFVIVLLSSSLARAEVVECSFTEPFFLLSYDSSRGTLTRTAPDSESGEVKQTLVARNVRWLRLGTVRESSVAHFARYSLVSRTGRKLLNLVLNYRGSDGMSDMIYPYAAEVYAAASPVMEDRQQGGCKSSTRKAILPSNESP